MSDDRSEAVLERHELDCPCGSGISYAQCCLNFLSGRAKPSTAEQLMRSRYTAFYFRNTDYLFGTHHPDTRSPRLRKELQSVVHNIMWRSLNVLAVVKGTKDDKNGKVEFECTYHQDGELHEFYEKSRFKRYKGDWKYYDDRG